MSQFFKFLSILSRIGIKTESLALKQTRRWSLDWVPVSFWWESWIMFQPIAWFDIDEVPGQKPLTYFGFWSVKSFSFFFFLQNGWLPRANSCPKNRGLWGELTQKIWKKNRRILHLRYLNFNIFEPLIKKSKWSKKILTLLNSSPYDSDTINQIWSLSHNPFPVQKIGKVGISEKSR